MKKWFCLLLAGALTFSLAACHRGQNQDIPPTESAGTEQTPNISNIQNATDTTHYTSPNNATQETTSLPDIYTETHGIYTYTVTSTQEGSTGQPTKTLTITNSVLGQLIQTLHFSENEWFTKSLFYLVDVTFDGNADLLVPFSRPASGVFFQAYVWDAQTQQYQYAPSFEDIPNIALDTVSSVLLSHRTASQLTSYGMYSYRVETNEFILIRSLRWEPKEDQNSLLITETAYMVDGLEVLIQQFAVSATATGLDKTDSKVAPYFSSNSIWNLDSNNWDNTVIPNSALRY